MNVEASLDALVKWGYPSSQEKLELFPLRMISKRSWDSWK